jgi:RsiW-degrading membrane proteinase PrsW (M82 family)
MPGLLNVAVALVPVLLFLVVLVFLDSFKLVSLRSVLLALGAGAVAALVGIRAYGWLLTTSGLSEVAFSRYAAPLVEEALKAAWIVLLLKRRRVGFLVDAAILGFAVGAGFALVENVEYLRNLEEPSVFLWLVRGFGTAVLHGATTAIFAMLAKGLSDRHPDHATLALVPGLLAAAFIHSLYNHFLLPPLAATAILFAALPPLMIVVFERSERTTRDWLGGGLDVDIELIESILSGEALGTRVGDYLRSLKARFPGEAVGDMLCLLRIQTELGIRAKGLLLAREAGLDVPVGEDVRANLKELDYLERAIGRTGLLALKPLLRRSAQDLWQIYMLSEAGGGGRRPAASRG